MVNYKGVQWNEYSLIEPINMHLLKGLGEKVYKKSCTWWNAKICRYLRKDISVWLPHN